MNLDFTGDCAVTLTLAPSGHLVMIDSSPTDASDLRETVPPGAEAVARAFGESQAAGIIALAGGKGKGGGEWSPSWLFWRDFGARYLLLLCHHQLNPQQLELQSHLDAATCARLLYPAFLLVLATTISSGAQYVLIWSQKLAALGKSGES